MSNQVNFILHGQTPRLTKSTMHTTNISYRQTGLGSTKNWPWSLFSLAQLVARCDKVSNLDTRLLSEL